MIRLLKRKWWITLIQGILFVIFSFYIFSNPVIILRTISLWMGLAVLFIGAVGVVSWMMDNQEDKETMPLVWSLVTCVLGLLMLSNMFSMMKAISILFGAWMLIAGLAILASGWNVRKKNTLGWGAVIMGLLAALGGLGMVLNLNSAAIGISSLLGVSVLLTGIAIILLAMIKKTVLKIAT